MSKLRSRKKRESRTSSLTDVKTRELILAIQTDLRRRLGVVDNPDRTAQARPSS
jgi:hypothetical protein